VSVSPYRERRESLRSLCKTNGTIGLNENSCENDDSCGWLMDTVFVSLFELIEAPHRVHTAKEVRPNCHVV